MEIEIKIDENCARTKIIIVADRLTEEINGLMQRLSDEADCKIIGFSDGCAKILEQSEIVRVYAQSGKVYAETADGEYQLRLRLYEAEQRLPVNSFVRISNSEIVNFKSIVKFDLSLSGTICVLLKSGKVYAETADGEYQLRLRLYEAEQRLPVNSFVRISNSEIVNFKSIVKFDLSLSGTICVLLKNGKITYASRRYVSKIKKTLGL